MCMAGAPKKKDIPFAYSLHYLFNLTSTSRNGLVVPSSSVTSELPVKQIAPVGGGADGAAAAAADAVEHASIVVNVPGHTLHASSQQSL